MKGIFFLIALLVVISCDKKDDPLKIVRDYNEALIYAYKSGDIRNLTKVAGEREVGIISVLIDTKRNAGLVLEASLEEIRVLRTEKTDRDAMLISTLERWRYFDRPIQPGKEAGPVIKADMEVQYECKKENGAWKVMKVKVLKTRYLNSKGANNN